MKRVAVVICGVLFMNAYAFGGIVTFTPEKVTVNPTVDGPKVKFDLVFTGVDPSGPLAGVPLTTFNAVVGSNAPGIVFQDFTFSAEVLGFDTAGAPAITLHPGKYAGDDVVLGWAMNFFSGARYSPPTAVGSLTVNVGALAPGSYDVFIDGLSAEDGSQSKVVSEIGGVEPLIGLGTINVIVPEPATVTLLGLASLALLRRRRRA